MNLRTLTGPLVCAVLFATPALALDVSKQKDVEAAPEQVWSAVGDFCAIADWHPAVTACETAEENGETRRTLTLDGGGTLVEELVSRDDEAMSYTYRIVEGPLPVTDYESTIAVSGEDETSTLSWEGRFDAADGASDDEASAVIGDIYDAGLQGIAQKAAAM